MLAFTDYRLVARRSNFVECLDALRAQVLANGPVSLDDLHALDVRLELPLRPALGVAHVVADLRSFPTVLAHCHDLACLVSVSLKSAE
jgi:hypothetical protein